jgi:hypothetical protein
MVEAASRPCDACPGSFEQATPAASVEVDVIAVGGRRLPRPTVELGLALAEDEIDYLV